MFLDTKLKHCRHLWGPWRTHGIPWLCPSLARHSQDSREVGPSTSLRFRWARFWKEELCNYAGKSYSQNWIYYSYEWERLRSSYLHIYWCLLRSTVLDTEHTKFKSKTPGDLQVMSGFHAMLDVAAQAGHGRTLLVLTDGWRILSFDGPKIVN